MRADTRGALAETLGACTSVFSPPEGNYAHQHKVLSGTHGLAKLGARALDLDQARGFRAECASRRYGTLTVGTTWHTGGVAVDFGGQFSHDHAVTRIAFLVEGTLTSHVGAQTLTETPGCGIMLPGDVPIYYTAKAPIRSLYVDIPADDPQFAMCLGQLAHWTGDAEFLKAARAYVEHLVTPGKEPTYADCAAMRGGLEALTNQILTAAPPLDPEQDGCRLHRDAMAAMRKDHRRIGLDGLGIARSLGVGHRRLQRTFPEPYTITYWLTKFRTDTAIALISNQRNAAVTLADLAERAGFPSLAAMRRAMQSLTGQTPSAYRPALGSR